MFLRALGLAAVLLAPTSAWAEEAPAGEAAAPVTTAPAEAGEAAPPAADADTDADAEPTKVAGGVPRERGPQTPAWETAPAEHRGGFTVGAAIGIGFGAANGFPNDAKKIGRAAFYTESGIGFATASSVWLGGALADWLTFGVGGGFSRIFADGVQSDAPLLVFHTDAYPLYSLGDSMRDLGLMVEMGLGFPRAVNDADEALIEGGGASYVFLGGVYEGIEAGPLRFGPYAGVHSMFSDTIRRPVAIFGFRGAFYADP